MCGNWGYQELEKAHYGRSIELMKQADTTIERILLLEGVPNMQRYSPVRVGDLPQGLARPSRAIRVPAARESPLRCPRSARPANRQVG